MTEGDIDVLARTIYGEARGEQILGQQAVAHVVLNRVARRTWYGDSVKAVCLKPQQFSCWNHDDPNRDVIGTANFADKHFLRAYGVACLVCAGDVLDPTRGATHYHHSSITPTWVWTMTFLTMIGDHMFYVERA